jgi:CO dehydrogenase nickel-insertion accessory protein CooC1
MRQEHFYALKITIEGEQGHGKTQVATELRELLNRMGACVIVRDDDGPDDGEFRHSMSTEDPRCDAYPLAQTMAYITTKYPK